MSRRAVGSRWIASFALLAFLSSAPVLAQQAAAPDDDPTSEKAETSKTLDDYELMRLFADVFEQIDRNYVEEVDKKKLVEAAINGMISELDPYSSLIPPKELTRFNEQVDQEFGGIGIQVQIDPTTNRLTVISPLPGTPAYKAGVQAGDTIMTIQGEDTEGFGIEDAVKLLKGKPGADIVIGVRHVGEKETVDLEMKRAIIHVSTVLGDHYEGDKPEFMLDDEAKVGYVRLTHFSRHTAEELKAAVDDLVSRGLKGLVIDLRNNPGGLLSQAREVADLFIREGRIVSTKGRNTRERVFDATRAGTYDDFPMAVLVNRYSASASEIVSAALQDHERAVIVGERTWGKGSVQNVIDVPGGETYALKLTTAGYFRPSGRNIHRKPDAKDTDEWGVSPNEGFKIRFTDEQLREYFEKRRERDVIQAEGPPESDYVDVQLEKALESVKSRIGDSENKAADAEAPKKKAA